MSTAMDVVLHEVILRGIFASAVFKQINRDDLCTAERGSDHLFY